MRGKTETTCLLDRAGVDKVADALTAFMQKTGMKRPDMIRLRFAMETLLLNVCEHFGEQAEVTVITGSGAKTAGNAVFFTNCKACNAELQPLVAGFPSGLDSLQPHREVRSRQEKGSAA